MSVVLDNVSFSYGQRKVLDGVSFTAREGELLSLLGPNGVGKSTLFRCILGLLHGYQGSITADGENITRMKAKELAGRIAYIPQSHYPAFSYSVFEMVLMGTTHRTGAFSSPGAREREQAEQALCQMGLEKMAQRSYNRISGGEQQLTLMARALAQQAKILILDEPTANLDFGNQIRVLTRVRSLAKAGYTVIQSTHNPDQTFLFSHHVVALKDGRVLADGAPGDIVTQELMQQVYGVDIEVQSLYGDRVRLCVPKTVLDEEGMER